MEKMYSVAEISILLNVGKEQVRRWIRDSRMNAYRDSKKGGWKVSESDFNTFLDRNPKYKKVAMTGSRRKDLALSNLNQRIFDIEELISKLKYELDELKIIRDLLKEES